MRSKSLMVICTHGTYGRDDDLYGALLVSNTSLAKGMKVTLLFVEDGVLTCKKNQNPAKIGLPNNLIELQDFFELGGEILVDKTSLKERGLDGNDIIDGVQIIASNNIGNIIMDHDVSLTF